MTLVIKDWVNVCLYLDYTKNKYSMKLILALTLISGFLVMSCKKETQSTTTTTDTVVSSDTIITTVPADNSATMSPADTASTVKGMDTVNTKK